MKHSQCIDHAFADSPPEFKIIANLLRCIAANYQPATPLHQIEGHADNRRVFTEQVRARREREQRMNRDKKPIFTRHIVSGWRYRAERRPAQNKLVAAKL